MKIIHLEDFIHPEAGYQVNLLAPYQARQGHNVQIITGELERIPDELTSFFGKDNIESKDLTFYRDTGVKIHRIPLLGFYSGRAIFRPVMLVKCVLSQTPDVLFLHGEDTLTGMIFIAISQWLPFPLVLDCHMLEMASRNRLKRLFRLFYRVFITPIILKRNIPLIRVVDSDFVQKCLGIPLSHTDLLSLGTDTTLFKPAIENSKITRLDLGISESSFLVLYAGKLDKQKGAMILAEAILKEIQPDFCTKVEFLIIGNSVGEYGEKVEKLLQISENKITRLPTQKYRDLPRFYQAADLVVYPKQCSLSFFDVQACGVPVLFEENEINHTRTHGNSAFTFTPDSDKDLRKMIIQLSSCGSRQKETLAINSRNFAMQTYDFNTIADGYTQVLKRAIYEWRSTNKLKKA